MIKHIMHLLQKNFWIILLILISIADIVSALASSSVHLSANPSGDAAACIQHPSATTCQVQVSPFGTGKPGAASCAAHASIPALIEVSDPTINEAPIATLQVWHSSACHAMFASAST